MLDPNSNIAEQLAYALSHHQNNLKDQSGADRKVELLRRTVKQLDTLSEQREQRAAPRPGTDGGRALGAQRKP